MSDQQTQVMVVLHPPQASQLASAKLENPSEYIGMRLSAVGMQQFQTTPEGLTPFVFQSVVPPGLLVPPPASSLVGPSGTPIRPLLAPVGLPMLSFLLKTDALTLGAKEAELAKQQSAESEARSIVDSLCDTYPDTVTLRHAEALVSVAQAMLLSDMPQVEQHLAALVRAVSRRLLVPGASGDA